MSSNDVAITGIGLVTPLGETAAENARAWQAGERAGGKPLEALSDTPFEGAKVAPMPQTLAPAERLGQRRMLKFMSNAAVYGCVAAREACEEAGLKARFDPERVGLYAATGIAAARLEDAMPMIDNSMDPDGNFSWKLLGEQGLPSTNPLMSFKILANMPPCLVSIQEGIKGPNLIFTPWEGQGAAALFEAWQAVAFGQVDCAVTGAADNPAHPASIVYLRQRGYLGEDETCCGGGAYLVMERAESALKAGKRIWATINSMEKSVGDGIDDPLAARMGRCFAAAPAVLLALAALCGETEMAICGSDHQRFRVVLGGPS